MTNSSAKHLTQSKTLFDKSHLCLKGFLLPNWREKQKRRGEWGKKDGHKMYFPFGM